MRDFTVKDFEGSGQYLIRDDKPANTYTDAGFMSTIMYKVGYHHGPGFKTRPERGNIMLLVSMSDGWSTSGYYDKHGSDNSDDWTYHQFNSKEDLVNYLNDPTMCKQGLRFATHDELMRVVLYQGSRCK